MRTYAAREAAGQEAYIVIEVDGHPQGPVRLYDYLLSGDSFCSGSRIIRPCASPSAVYQTGIQAYDLAFGFNTGKNLGALCDASLLTCKSTRLAAILRVLRNYGSHEKYKNLVQSPNVRLDESQATLLRVKLEHVNVDNGRRQ